MRRLWRYVRDLYSPERVATRPGIASWHPGMTERERRAAAARDEDARRRRRRRARLRWTLPLAALAVVVALYYALLTLAALVYALAAA